MGAIVLVRHGQASFGADDYDRLSPLGEEQARLLGGWARDCGFNLGQVALGTARRHRQSAEQCLTAYGAGPAAQDWIVDAGFDEFDHHEVMIRFRPDLAEPGALGHFLAQSDHPHRAFQQVFAAAVARWVGGAHDGDYRESWPAFRQRCRAGLDRLMATMNPAQDVWVFTSGGAITALLQGVLAIPDERIFELNWTLVNTGVTQLRYRPGRVSLRVSIHSPRPLAGQGLGERAEDSLAYPLSLTLSPLPGGEGTEQLRLSYLNSQAHLERQRRPALITYR